MRELASGDQQSQWPKARVAKIITWEDAHAPDAENAGNGNFGPRVHAQVPDQRHREKADGEVGDRRADAVEIRDGNERVLVDASTVRTGGSLVPVVGNRVALEDGEEEEGGTDRDGQRHRRV